MPWQYKFLAVLVAGLIASGLLLLILSEFHEEITEPWFSALDQRTMSIIQAMGCPPAPSAGAGPVEGRACLVSGRTDSITR
jgi:hypothetical protein